MKLRRLGLSVSLMAAIVAAFSVTPASAASSRHVLPGTKPSWTSAAPRTADVAGSQQVTAQVWLTPRNAKQLDAFAAAVSDPSSAQYGHFISSAQYVATYAPTSAQVASITSWLNASGLHVDKVGPDNSYVAVSGAAAAVNAAFGTTLSHYKVNGKDEQAPSQDVSVPDGVADSVTAVTGLTTFGHRVTAADMGAPGGFRNDGPLSDYYGQKLATDLPQFNGQYLPYAVKGYTPSQFRSAYGVTASGLSGAGQAVAITDAFDSPRLGSDANQYATNRGDAAFAAGQFQDRSVPECTTTTGLSCAQLASDCGGSGWYGEQNLDVEAVHGMAPKATVLYYGAGSCYDNDLLAALAQVVSDNQASIVTNSWGEPTIVNINGQLFETIDQNLINAYENVFKRGASQGIGFYFSSGDNGDEALVPYPFGGGYKHPDWPTGDTWVTSVGGTSLAIDQNGNRQFETGWGTQQYRLVKTGSGFGPTCTGTQWYLRVPFQYGAGGGYSQIFKEPGWQKKVVQGDTTGGRAVPDISMDGDPTTGMLIGITQDFGAGGIAYGEYRIGGTSLASPLFAGLQAVAQTGRGRIGFASPFIYAQYHGHSNIYYDVTPQGDPGNVRVDYFNSVDASQGIRCTVRSFNQDSSLTTGAGWDDVTGVGTPTAAYISLVNQG